MPLGELCHYRRSAVAQEWCTGICLNQHDRFRCPPCAGSPGPVLFLAGGADVDDLKPFRSYADQVSILESRGMLVEDRGRAERQLRTLNYYRLSGYWHTMRKVDRATKRSLDSFRPGATFDLVVELYEFDERLRAAIFAELAPVELAVRALIGHHLGKIDPLVYLDPHKMGPLAVTPKHDEWRRRFKKAIRSSKEEFIEHHKNQYSGSLPIWVAVEVMDWGMLSHLYGMSPVRVRDDIAVIFHLSAPQLGSWLKCLNILRNYAAHHARIFNRSFDIKPKLCKKDERLNIIREVTNRSFGQLTLVRYLSHELGLPDRGQLPSALTTFPENDLVPFSRLGAPQGWQDHPLWVVRTT